MSSVASTSSYRRQTSPSWSGPSRIEEARNPWRYARSYWNSISFRTTGSRPGIDFSAAVAARSAGCSYAFGEMSFSRRASSSFIVTRAYASRAVGACADRVAHGAQAGLGTVVGVPNAGLEAFELRLVRDVEEKQHADVRLAAREPDRLGVPPS